MKTAIIGLDGATFDIITPMVKAGQLPVLARLMSEGSHAPLRSTILPNSFPGWASCTTGTSEGMHGIFSPFIKQSHKYGVRAMSGRDIMTKTIWDLLTEQGGRSLLVNIPTTYPPQPLNGVMITGMLTPGLDSDFTYPLALKEEMLAAVPAYVIEPGRNQDRKVRAADFRHASDMHELAAHFLMDRGDWDFLMIVFSVLDRAQHDFWADMDSSHPRHNRNTSDEFRGFIHETYRHLDAAVGRLVEKLPSDARVFVVSDHGFCAELMEIRVNEVLASAGLLTFKTSTSSRKNRARIDSFKSKITNRMTAFRPTGNSLERKVSYGAAFLDEIDWAQTRAYFAQDKGVWVNLAGRENLGIVPEARFDEVIKEARAALSQLRSPDDGLTVFEKLASRDEAFKGVYSTRLPDLVMTTRRDEYVYNERPSYGDHIVPADSTTGTHSRDGIFIAWGRGINKGASFDSQPNLRDVAPAALHSLGCPLTEDMDSRFLHEVFQDATEPRRAGASYLNAEPVAASAAGQAYSDTEEAALKEKLRALGYIE
jgi:predicted AlkP superfamily phosphohydrolase/phosphomutase